MAYTEEDITRLAGIFADFSADDQTWLGGKSTQDIAAMAVEVVGSLRKVGMESTVAALVSGLSVSNWTALRSAAESADGATLVRNVTAFDEALTAGNATNLMRSAVAGMLAARKVFLS